MAAKNSKYPIKTNEKNIEQTGEDSFRVRMMSAGHKINKTFDTIDEAKVYRDLVKANSALDVHESQIFEARVKKAESKTYTFANAIKSYRIKKTAGKKGWESEASRLDKIERCTKIVNMPLYQIKADHILELLEWIRTSGTAAKGVKSKVASESTVKRYYSLIHHVLQIAVDELKKIDRNPVAAIPKSARPKSGKGRDRRLRGNEYEQLLSVLKGQEKVIFILAVETSMRRGEQLNMRWEDLDSKARTLLLPDTKIGESRTIYLSHTAIDAFKSLEIQGIKGKIITLTEQQLRYRWVKAREQIGAPDLRIHDLRHEATSRMFESGFGEIEAATQTGHKSLQMLKRYAHLKQGHILEKLDRPARPV